MSLIALSLVLGVTTHATGRPEAPFSQDVSFLKKYTKVVVLKGSGTSLAIVPAWQCRVVTSTLDSSEPGFGWINYEHISSGKLVPHINVFGGEDRIWLGPEGGQFSIFFKHGAKFDLAHWQTPAPIDSESFKVDSQASDRIKCSKRTHVTNYSGTRFDVKITRTIKILPGAQAFKDLGIQAPADVKVAAYESENELKNVGKKTWTEKSGLLSIWILGMYKHSPTTTVVVPFKPLAEGEQGKVVNDSYFGKVPSDRLKIGTNAAFFKADGKYRSKIGLNPKHALNVIGSYDPIKGVLNILQFTKPEGVTRYVNSMWEIQKQPFAGDSVNSYNDGPPAPGAKPLGPFYEIESSSPAAALKPGQTILHVHRTMHFKGPKESLETIAKAVLGVDLDDVSKAFESGS